MATIHTVSNFPALRRAWYVPQTSVPAILEAQAAVGDVPTLVANGSPVGLLADGTLQYEADNKLGQMVGTTTCVLLTRTIIPEDYGICFVVEDQAGNYFLLGCRSQLPQIGIVQRIAENGGRSACTITITTPRMPIHINYGG